MTKGVWASSTSSSGRFKTMQHSREILSHSPAHKLFVARLLGYFVLAMSIA
jgi:hypothetical protein